jgi:hypothetical protein
MKIIECKILLWLILTIFVNTIFAQSYNPDAAIDYAKKWCDKRNPKYKDYTEDGGDCAAFVSQCLRAGGLDLSAGTNGRGAYVKPDSVIAGATQLIQHLKNYQNTEYAQVHGCKPPASHDVGDPMFIMKNDNPAEGYHSYFCSSLDINANRLYSAHTNFACDVNTNSFFSGYDRTYFHIKNSIPAHCENCVQDGDETGIDCGGSCPPCQHAPENKIYTVANESQRLPAETYAISNITARDAVTVVAGSTVAFYTAGSIDLLPGFEAKQGSGFSAQAKKKRLEATADCNAYCDPDMTYNGFTILPTYYPMQYELANASSITVSITQQVGTRNSTPLVYESTFAPPQDGSVVFWDLVSGSPNYAENAKVGDRYIGGVHYANFQFYAIMWITPCQGGKPFEYKRTIYVQNLYPASRSAQANSNSDTHSDNKLFATDGSDITDTPDDLFFLYPNPTSGALTISSSEPLQAFSDLTLTNGSGQTVYGQKYLDNFTLSLPALPNGEYILSVQINRQLVSRKVIIQR